jgi:hypothetical protein
MRRLLFAVASLTALALTGRGNAGVEADPAKEYLVTPDAGPWMICATCYVGPQSAQLAHEMVLEIRSRYGLPAFVRNKGEEQRREQRERLKKYHEEHPEANVPLRIERIQDQCAVLIGGYPDMDSAHRMLKQVKKFPPPSNERLCPIFSEVGPANEDGNAPIRIAAANPFAKSFVCRNPSMPAENKMANRKNDPLLKKFNAGEKYSLLQCKKPYTLMVAAYQGMSTIQQEEKTSFMEKLWGNNHALEASGQNAHNLAEVLHNPPLGFEAYVLHIREGSIVTIGGFDSPDDPRLREVEKALQERMRVDQGGVFLANPLPIEVPRP